MTDRKRKTSTTKLKILWERARADLIVSTKHRDQCTLIWDHSARVGRSAGVIASLPVVQAQSPDEAAIAAAALYHDAGWVSRLQDGEASFEEILLDPLPDAHREQGARLLQRSLEKHLPGETLARASRAINTLNDRDNQTIESQVVAEADNLDEFGVLALWSTIRRGALSGKGVQSAVDTWHRRREYRFWDARLKDSFRFPAVRAVAQQRLDRFESLMAQLEDQHLGEDLQRAITLESADSSPERSLR